MDDNLKNNGQFRMRIEESMDDNVIPAQVDDLRMERLSTKVTIISIIIPVLIAVVIAIAYLDMKKRVIRTEDTGTTGVENLSKDVESRFSNLSLRQANLESQIKKMDAENDKAAARIQVKLKKIEDVSRGLKNAMITKSLLESKAANLQQQVNIVAQAVEDERAQVAEATQQINTQMEQINTNTAQNQSQLAQIEEKLTSLDQGKIDKASLDLALRLEILKLKKAQQAQLEELRDRIVRLEKRLAATPKTTTAPSPSPTNATKPKPAGPSPGGGIVEQKIGK